MSLHFKILHCERPKNTVILFHNQSIVVNIRKFNVATILLLSICQFVQGLNMDVQSSLKFNF